jgi:hypothetical protein
VDDAGGVGVGGAASDLLDQAASRGGSGSRARSASEPPSTNSSVM